ncbi:MAG: RNA polymerase sigma factor [Candidatus Dormibacteraceae bacterium]
MASNCQWPSAQLIVAAQQGDETSIAALCSGSHPHVRRFAFSLCASPQDAKDAAQEALIILFRKIGTLRATGALGSWMFQIVRNECRRRARLLVHRIEPIVDEPVPSAEDDALRRLEVDQLAALIAALPAEQRLVLIMRDVQRLPGSLVAKSLGLSSAAMKSRLHRARAAVRDNLQTKDWDVAK